MRRCPSNVRRANPPTAICCDLVTVASCVSTNDTAEQPMRLPPCPTGPADRFVIAACAHFCIRPISAINGLENCAFLALTDLHTPAFEAMAATSAISLLKLSVYPRKFRYVAIGMRISIFWQRPISPQTCETQMTFEIDQYAAMKNVA